MESMSVSFWHFVAWIAQVHISQTPLHIKRQICFRIHCGGQRLDSEMKSGRERGRVQGYALQITVGVWGSGAYRSGRGFLVLRSQSRQNNNFPKPTLRQGSHFPPQCSPTVPSGSHAQRPVYGQPSQQHQHLVLLLNPFLLKSTICPLHSNPYKQHTLPFSHAPASSK